MFKAIPTTLSSYMKYENNIAHFHQSVDMSSDREERFFQRQQRQRFAEATAKDQQIAALEAAAVENEISLAVKDHRIAVLERDLYRAIDNNRDLCDSSIYITYMDINIHNTFPPRHFFYFILLADDNDILEGQIADFFDRAEPAPAPASGGYCSPLMTHKTRQLSSGLSSTVRTPVKRTLQESFNSQDDREMIMRILPNDKYEAKSGKQLAKVRLRLQTELEDENGIHSEIHDLGTIGNLDQFTSIKMLCQATLQFQDIVDES